MPKYYAETITHKIIVDRKQPEEAAKALISSNPDIAYDAMRGNGAMFIFVSETGFGAEYRTDMMFDIIEMVYKMNPSGDK